DAGEVLDLLEAEKPTVTNGFVAPIAHLARHPSFPGRDLSSMTRGNLYPIMAAHVRPKDPELRHNMLGMTEAGSVLLISGDETDQPEHRRGSFGIPAPGFETKIVDPDTGVVLGVNHVGELCIRGPYLMQGYYGRSREECFADDGWFHTGDLARQDGDGFVYYVGRRGAMIKTAGANVSPAEVQKAIAKVTHGTVAHVVGIPDDEKGQVVAAVLVGEHDIPLDALKDKLRGELSVFKIPKRFAQIKQADVPLLSSGKVDLERLRAMFDG
ncbi:MAG: long-chain fatty acid--CoA ligase, partial [Mycobacteriaceae bacterium]|nr:long-chain fatty acid--CoA ligase [Mycobacteriaceae bacterium]